MIRRIGAWATLCASLAGGPALAVDGIAIELGGSDDADMGRVALQWNWQRRLHQGPGWNIGGYWDLGLGHWHWRKGALPAHNDDIAEIGLTPVLRLQRDDSKGFFCEIGAGLHLQSRSTFGDRQMSTLIQFGSHAGVGYRFGTNGAYEISYRFQHLSNADIKMPNDGINFSQVRLQYHF